MTYSRRSFLNRSGLDSSHPRLERQSVQSSNIIAQTVTIMGNHGPDFLFLRADFRCLSEGTPLVGLSMPRWFYE